MGIKLLEDQLINKIAAGEVVERPASIVKELVENSIDAGSTRIEVQISGGGIDRIEVADNGTGILPEEVGLALQRHATSKINCEEDLFAINTMGFRGEALPSIASICRLELWTQAGSEPGIKASQEGGQNLQIQAHPTSQGTKISVRELFFNTPARRKFLKSPVAEAMRIHETISSLALSRPDISFAFSTEKKLYFKTPGNGVLRDAVTAIYGRDFANLFWEVKCRGDNYAVEGLISKPDVKRSNRKQITLFVNRRLVKNPMLSRAVEEAYRGKLLSREYPAVILFITVPPTEVDVNVHPQKSEVRFRDESTLFRLISHGLRARLDGVQSLTVTPQIVSSNPVSSFPGRQYDYQPGLLPFSPQHLAEPEGLLTYAGGESWADGIGAVQAAAAIDEELAIIGQCWGAYILAEHGDALWIIDQHAAQERILYNQLLAKRINRPAVSQILSPPLPFELSAADMDLLNDHRDLIASLGFEIEEMGCESAVLRSAPPQFQGSELEVIHTIIEVLADENQTEINLEQEICAAAACKQAIKAGERLTRPEMAALVNELIHTDNYRHCPHGRPIILEFNHLELDKRFKRK